MQSSTTIRTQQPGDYANTAAPFGYALGAVPMKAIEVLASTVWKPSTVVGRRYRGTEKSDRECFDAAVGFVYGCDSAIGQHYRATYRISRLLNAPNGRMS